MGSAFLTSLAQLGSQVGDASNEARQEKAATAEKAQKMDVEQAYLQIAKQSEARQQQEQDYRKKAGDLIEFKDGRLWSVSQGKFIEDRQQSDPLEHLQKYYATLDPKIRDKARANTEALTAGYAHDPRQLVEKSLEYTHQLTQRQETEAAEEERRQKSQLSIDNRAKLAREAASGRQRNAFAEREKLNSRVLTNHESAIDADNRVTRMVADMTDAENAERDPKKYPDGAGAFDMDMLSQHVALTFGAIKGGMRSKAMIDEHRNAVALLERVQRAYQSGTHGSQLSSEQRRNFLKLGRIAQQAAYDKYNAIKSDVQSGAVAPPQEQQQFDIQPEQP
jgi:hypothetical protein